MFRLPRRPIVSPSMRYVSALFSLVTTLGGCALPKNINPEVSAALSLEQTQSSHLHQTLAPLVKQHPGLSGIYPLADASEAFAVRVLLAKHAQLSLDVQYYIWRADTTGFMLLQALKKAADRGVRVRLLLDDNGTRNLDEILSALNHLPNIDIRLFNPFVIRQPKGIGFFFDFKRLNHRMHNKSFTVDNSLTIVGGRNIGDEYFGVEGSVMFADLDILAAGHVVPKVSKDFDRYWNHQLAYPLNSIVKPNGGNSTYPHPEPGTYIYPNAHNHSLGHYINNEGKGINFRGLLAQYPKRVKQFSRMIQQTNTIEQLISQELDFEWVKTEIVSDDPDKAQGKATAEGLLSYQLHHAIGSPTQKVDLISPYFVPTATGVLGFKALIKEKGVRVRVLTNSYDATDVHMVHAGYMKHRKSMLRAGIELYELKKINHSTFTRIGKNPMGISGSSLHAKTFAVDNKQLFVGSFNFDPRSALLNTELGFVIHSPKLARQISSLFQHDIPSNSYKVILNEHSQLRWLEQNQPNEKPKIHEIEPRTTLIERFWLGFLSRLPIEWML